jgi:hypothetical protein
MRIYQYFPKCCLISPVMVGWALFRQAAAYGRIPVVDRHQVCTLGL